MGFVMGKGQTSRVRVAALILSCVGIALAASSAGAFAQSLSGPVSTEAPSDALARNMRVLATSPRSLEALIGAGRAALALGDTQAAAGFFGRAEEVHPSSPLPHIGMGAAVLADGEATGALAYFARAQQLGANGALMGKDRGLAYDLLGRHGEAQADYKAALYGPEADEARRRLALSLAITGDRDGALAQLAPLISRRDSGAVRCRALVLALSGDVAAARSSIETAMPGAAGQMDPFLRRLSALTSGQKAAAVNLGIFPNSVGSVVAASPAPPAVGYSSAGDRLASVEQLLRAPQSPAATPAPAPAQARPPLRQAGIPMPRPALSSDSSSAYDRPKIWLQLASGANAAALPDQFQRIKRRHRDLLEGISGYVAEGPDRARLLIGPFKSKSDAQIFAEDLASVSVKAFSWTNPVGQNIRKLSVE